jgi:flagellar motility protein MotE (MotC chaperone)
MRIAFFIVCVAAALAFSILAFVRAAGRFPFEAAPVKPKAAAVVPEHLNVFADERRSVDDLVESLTKERQLYATRLAGLDSRDRQLQSERDILNRLREDIFALQQSLSNRVVEIKATEAANLRQLAAVYSKMEADVAATALQQLEPERAAGILANITDRQAAGILGATVAQGEKGVRAAANWTDIIRRIRNEPKKKASS